MRQRLFIITFLGFAAALALVSCKKEKTPTNSNPNQIPTSIARISGSVHDAAGNPLSDVFLHIVYPQAAPAQMLADPQTPTSAVFSSGTDVLYTECNGSVPLPDGVMVKIFWDRNGNGSDDSDGPPPLCSHPPECRDGPPFTVNLTEFAMNGVAQDMGAGRFFMEQAFMTVSDVLRPNRFYARILCADGRTLYESQVLDLPSGPSTDVLHFTCTQCTGEPVIPQWILNPSYPNPAADSLTLSYGLQANASTLITLRGAARGRVDTLVNAVLPSGPHVQRVALRTAATGWIANGLYTVHFQTASYDQQHDILKNDTVLTSLQNTEAATTTASDGSFTLDAPAGISLTRRGEQGDSLGLATLARLRVVAIRAGFTTADTFFAVSGGQGYNVNLVLRNP
jgi:hypothetical protein